ncbi:DEAD-box ATP-dependent RNA helicase CshB [Granulosicoccus antarcticus IMCC3135]|uniref:DEAD-box ATP-dependent RNA helicase CshB n=2 Tax=Granulosicoccus TaxID=437504 RepID=A0A2Z2NX93_9GAMM|nr:DEAD-box ATP-dependent RNA helicase CshB [Granulosicoccus antarcticus IMCC3135]
MNLQQAMDHTERWYESRGWTVFDFQREAWKAWHENQSGLIHSPTGSGKTLAAWLGPVQDAMSRSTAEATGGDPALRVLWITPLRALASDTRNNLEAVSDALGAGLSVEIRTGDTSSSRRTRQRQQPPFALVTTPESLSVMLSYPGSEIGLANIHTVVVDEWHELLGSKRGVQLQLCLARLRKLCKNLRIWGVSATLANLDQARDVLLGPGKEGTLIRGVVPRSVEVCSILPTDPASFKWSGHLGLQLIKPVIQAIDNAGTTLLFTNTRSQAELWFQALLNARPDWLESVALHHGSLDRKLRVRIEDQLRSGELSCVVCTSSLDLGVDFSPVDQVMQVGSPKGIARLLQRAGRSGHRPGAVSRILCVPSNALELVEITAVRNALAEKRIEARQTPQLSLDVLCQHLVTIAMGSGFIEQDMLNEIRDTYSFAELTDAQWQWVMDFITRGGQALKGYPQYHKVLQVAGVHRVMNEQIQQRHRMAIGTINSDAQLSVVFQGGKRLGTAEESFIARLKPGDTFQFAGRHLEFIRIREMTAYVRKATKRSRVVPRWGGTQLPLTSALADSVLQTLHLWQQGELSSPELLSIDATLKLQQQWSYLPGPNDFLIEYIRTQEGYSLFCFPFAGSLAHEGLAMVVASRLSALTPSTFTLQVNDYGFELQSPEPVEFDLDQLRQAFSVDHLLADILNSINTSEIAKRRFRDIARISGLVFDGYPGRAKTAKQLQASSGLIFDVLENHDPDNLLLDQARREVLDQQLEFERLKTTMQNLQGRQWRLERPERLTPLSFPLWADSLNSQTITSQSFQQRIQAMLDALESASDDTLQTT